jgi:hypothetical protein
MRKKIVEYEDMTDYQKRLIDATKAGTFPEGLTKDELIEWIKSNLMKG